MAESGLRLSLTKWELRAAPQLQPNPDTPDLAADAYIHRRIQKAKTLFLSHFLRALRVALWRSTGGFLRFLLLKLVHGLVAQRTSLRRVEEATQDVQKTTVFGGFGRLALFAVFFGGFFRRLRSGALLQVGFQASAKSAVLRRKKEGVQLFSRAKTQGQGEKGLLTKRRHVGQQTSAATHETRQQPPALAKATKCRRFQQSVNFQEAWSGLTARCSQLPFAAEEESRRRRLKKSRFAAREVETPPAPSKRAPCILVHKQGSIFEKKQRALAQPLRSVFAAYPPSPLTPDPWALREGAARTAEGESLRKPQHQPQRRRPPLNLKSETKEARLLKGSLRSGLGANPEEAARG